MWPQESFKVEEGEAEGNHRDDDVRAQSKVASVENRGRSHEPKNVAAAWSPKRQGNEFSPGASRDHVALLTP